MLVTSRRGWIEVSQQKSFPPPDLQLKNYTTSLALMLFPESTKWLQNFMRPLTKWLIWVSSEPKYELKNTTTTVQLGCLELDLKLPQGKNNSETTFIQV